MEGSEKVYHHLRKQPDSFAFSWTLSIKSSNRTLRYLLIEMKLKLCVHIKICIGKHSRQPCSSWPVVSSLQDGPMIPASCYSCLYNQFPGFMVHSNEIWLESWDATSKRRSQEDCGFWLGRTFPVRLFTWRETNCHAMREPWEEACVCVRMWISWDLPAMCECVWKWILSFPHKPRLWRSPKPLLTPWLNSHERLCARHTAKSSLDSGPTETVR